MAARDRRRRRAPRPGPAAAATPPPSRDRRSLRRGPGPGRAAAAALDARRLLPLLHQRARLLALLAPGIELVRLDARLPRLLRLRLVTREPVRAAQLVMGLDQVRPEVVAERDEAPALLDEGRGADVVGVDGGSRPRELRGRRLRRRRGELFVAVDQLADLLLQLAQLADERVDLLEEGDDLALHHLTLGPPGRRVELARDRIVLRPQGANRGIDHQDFAVSLITPSMATFSFELSSRAVFSAMTVRPSFTTIPVMYSAASPFTMFGGAVTSLAATCSTSVTTSTTTPSLPPSHSRMTVRVSSRCGAGAPSRLRKSTSGTAPP